MGWEGEFLVQMAVLERTEDAEEADKNVYRVAREPEWRIAGCRK